MSKECSKNKILNPKTNRCVSIDGKIGKSILASIKKENKKECEKYKILNPKTNRCVSIDGKIGKSILASIKQKTKKETKKETKEKIKFTLNIKTPLDHSLNQKQVEKYINACDLETRPILRKIFDNTIHISFETFIKNLNKNIKHLIDYVQDNKIIYFYIDEQFQAKSNYWVYMYIKDYFNLKYPNFKLVLIKDFDNVKSNDYIVFVDDCIYSGYQMSSNISHLNRINTSIFELNIFLLCSYISSEGLNRIEKTLSKLINKNIFMEINKYIYDIPLINDYLTAEEIEIIDKYNEPGIDSVDGLYLIYFDHKLADSISTITHIYSGYVLNKNNQNLYLELTGYVDDDTISKFYDKLDIIPIINNCENIKNYDLFTPKCPFTPYKITFDNLIKKFKKDKQFIKFKSVEDKKIKIKNKNISI